MTGPIQITQPQADATDYAPTILPGFGPFSHVERYSLGRQGEFSHYGIMPNGQAVPLEDVSGGSAAGPGTPGQPAPANDTSPPLPGSAPAAAPSPVSNAPMPDLGPAAGPSGAAGPSPTPAAPQPMAPLRIAEPDPVPDIQPGQAAAADVPKGGGITVDSGNGHSIAFPEGTDPATIQAVMTKLHASSTVPPDSAIDKETGAPASARFAVGAAQTDQDRLSTLQKFFPDAQPYGNGNFVFTNPRNGRPTLYNEDFRIAGIPVPTMGDIASISPEIGEAVGGAIGGAGAVAAGAATGGLGAAAIPAGVGLGAAAGRELVQRAASTFGPTVDTRSGLQQAVDTGTTAGFNAVAGPVAEKVIAPALRTVAGPVMNSVRNAVGGANNAVRNGAQAASDFAQTNIKPLPSWVSGQKWQGYLEQAGKAIPGSSAVIGNKATAAYDAFRQAVDAVGQRMGNAGSKQEAGEVIKQSAENAAEKFGRTNDKFQNALYKIIGENTRGPATALQDLQKKIFWKMEQDPGTRKTYEPILKQLTGYVGGIVEKGGMTFGALHKERRLVGAALRDPNNATKYRGAQKEDLEALYGALSQSMEEIARNVGPKAEMILKRANEHVKDFRAKGGPAELLDAIHKTASPEAAYAWALAGSKDGGTRLQRLRASMTPKEWGDVAASVWSMLGTEGAADGKFSISTFLTNYAKKLSPEAREALWGGNVGKNFSSMEPLQAAMDRLIRVADRIKSADRMANHSNTASVLAGIEGIQASGHALMTGDLMGVAQMLGLQLVGPYIAAKIFTSPAFVNWFADGFVAKNLVEHLTRLAVIAKAEPDVKRYLEAITAQAQGN